MRLWHQTLITRLPRQQLLGQHRECCALRGKGWMKPHSTVNYVFQHPMEYLFQYHQLVIEEMEKRGYYVGPEWKRLHYRGKHLPETVELSSEHFTTSDPIYPEHTDTYLKECLDNLSQKGIFIDFPESHHSIDRDS
ncbi:TIGR02328 family protein [Alicyclobacillus tolerans]|uniref:Uncharacterized protein (TIGR02328 family) n=1 Tax=Alicyclobacillus tolerans TaxID=90970 RepID=A0ABT9LXE6_9BACL|nr:TIGR02328 family protein [Alicyclobacillus tengchongensis]MDP9728943.1 uncharacterized protein (TIGR02328 family) [Alicyclobacillus tengchongensis]